jgi:hypothetical protein
MQWNGSQCARSDAPAASASGEVLHFVAQEQEQSFTVSVESGGVTKTCPAPVTYYDACTLTGLPAGRARLHLGGDAALDTDMKIEESGRAEVKLSHRGHGLEIGTDIAAGVGLGMVGYGLADSSFFSGSGHVGDIILVSLGGAIALVCLPGGIANWFTAHDWAYVERDGKPSELDAAPSRVRVGIAPARGGAMIGGSLQF